MKQSLSSFISSANILACLTTFGIVGGSLACWWKELLRSSYRGDLLLRYAQKYIKSGTHYLQHLLHTADIPLIALAVASGSMAFLGVNDAVRAIRNPNAAMRMISSGSLSHVRPPEPENMSMISAKVSQSECLLSYRLDSSIIVSCHSRDSRSRTTSNACLHELMHTLRRFAQFTEDKAVEGATYAVLSFPTDHAGCDQRSAVLICATLLCLCARALRGSLSRNRWVVCAVYSRLCKVHDAGTRKT